ncbi:ATP-binding cassette domain-containing protein [Sphingobacterium sp. E70]|uniref:ATP-binding cassette domain-containing protein n=1 Tax=Sphingobacterium sp. E70 TaxID=2853439 RepID=UPI00211C80B5|nr:ATP-binding cassette domain-containing protein [Sphingobacterium sp. E70]ULT24561.1 ATP-binding cassette domain-containing protein [Sphingobacterium sp. E70]
MELRQVFFEYPNGTQALKDVSFAIKPNEITALVGLSGAGKSTIINLLDKFYEPTGGQILLDGVDLANYDTAFLRQHIGMVLQRNHIFKGTIFENIEYGKMGSSREEIVEAAKKPISISRLWSCQKVTILMRNCFPVDSNSVLRLHVCF